MKVKLIIDIEKKGDQLEVKYTRRDLKAPDSKDDKLIVLYIEGLVRSTIDSGFAPAKKKEEENGANINEQQELSNN